MVYRKLEPLPPALPKVITLKGGTQENEGILSSSLGSMSTLMYGLRQNTSHLSIL